MTQTQLQKTSIDFLLKELVQMPTITSEKATSRAALDWIKYQVRDLPLYITDFEHDGYSSVIMTTRRTKHVKVLLSTHVDVAPAPAADFTLREEGGRYYGRGVFDMKFAIAVYLNLLLSLGDELKNYDLGVVITTDEEVTGGSKGAGPIVKAGWSADVVVDPDAIVPGWAIQSEGKGILRYRVHSQGESGHGSRPWAYRSAVTQLMEYLHSISAHFPQEPCGDDDHRHPTLNIGVIQGGVVANQVANRAHADLDIRLMPGQTPSQVAEILHEAGDGYPGISFESLASDMPFELDTSSPYVARLQDIIAEVTGRRPAFTLAHGGSEASYYAAADMPVLLFGCPGGNHHAAGEWIDKQGLGQFAQVVREFVEAEALVK